MAKLFLIEKTEDKDKLVAVKTRYDEIISYLKNKHYNVKEDFISGTFFTCYDNPVPTFDWNDNPITEYLKITEYRVYDEEDLLYYHKDKEGIEKYLKSILSS